MADQKKNTLFREKSLELMESPESLNDYLKVTSPGVWIILSAIIVLLIGVVIWSIFGRIQATENVAVVSDSGGECVCLVPYEDLENIMNCNSITVNSETYTLERELDPETQIVSEDTNPYIRIAGSLAIGDVVVVVPVNAEIEEGIYTGAVVTESLQPMSLLLD